MNTEKMVDGIVEKVVNQVEEKTGERIVEKEEKTVEGIGNEGVNEKVKDEDKPLVSLPPGPESGAYTPGTDVESSNSLEEFLGSYLTQLLPVGDAHSIVKTLRTNNEKWVGGVEIEEIDLTGTTDEEDEDSQET